MSYPSVQPMIAPNQGSPLVQAIIAQVGQMELVKADKTQLADFAISRIPHLHRFAWRNWGCGIVSARVEAHRVLFGVNVPNDLIKKALGMDAQVSHATGATANVMQLRDGKIAVAIQSPFQVNVPSFRQLVTERRFVRGQYMFGYVNGKIRPGAWQDVLNLIIAGLSQSGKTTTARFFMAQHLMNGAQFVIVDPQANAGEKALTHQLAGLPLVAPIAVYREQWLQAIAYVDKIGEMRSNGNPDRTPLILVVDEANDLFDDKEIGPVLIDMLKKITRAYSKVMVNALVIGHDFRADSLGGSASLREMFQSRIVHNMSKGSAQTLIDNKDYKEAISQQKPGRAHIRFADGEIVRATIPQTTTEDLNQLATMMGNRVGKVNPTLSWDNFVKQSGGKTTAKSSPSSSSKMQISPTQLPDGHTVVDVLHLIAGGHSASKIVEQVWGLTSGYGYQQAAKTVTSIAADAVSWAIENGYTPQGEE